LAIAFIEQEAIAGILSTDIFQFVPMRYHGIRGTSVPFIYFNHLVLSKQLIRGQLSSISF